MIKISFNSLSAHASCVLPVLSVRGCSLLFHPNEGQHKEEQRYVPLPGTERGRVIIPAFLGRLGLVTRVSSSQGLLFLRGSPVLQECGRHSALCSRPWGGVWNTPGPGYEVPGALICPEKFLRVSGGALMFSARWLRVLLVEVRCRALVQLRTKTSSLHASKHFFTLRE